MPDVRLDPRYVKMAGTEALSEIIVPIIVKGTVIGVLDVQSRRADAFDETDRSVLQALAHQTGAAIENTRLYEQAQQAAVVEERSRLARELHDAVTQTLFSASLLAEVLPATWEMDQARGRELLQELRQLSRGALAEMRTLLLELRPSVLAEADLSDLLRQLAEAVAGRTGMAVQVTVEPICDLPDDVRIALYRIAQEALNNVVKHARAQHASVDLRCTDDGDGDRGCVIRLVIHDDGVGFDLDAIPQDRLGLGIICERTSSIGASLTLDSRPGQGTTITVVWRAAAPDTSQEGKDAAE